MIAPPGGGPAKLVQAPSAAGVPRSGDLAMSTLDYDDAGHVTVTGQATPGVVVRVYINDNLVAEGAAGADGRWKLAPPDPIGPGKHTLRLDRLASDGKPVARLELPFDRVVVAPGTKDSRRLIVVRGDNLWNIARAHYGVGYPSHGDLRGQQGTDPQSRSDLSWPSLQPAQGQLRPRQQRTFHAGEFLRADPRRRLALHRDLCRDHLSSRR